MGLSALVLCLAFDPAFRCKSSLSYVSLRLAPVFPLQSGSPSTVESLLGFYPLYRYTISCCYLHTVPLERIQWNCCFLPTYRSDGTNIMACDFFQPTYRSDGTNTIALIFFSTHIPFRWNEKMGDIRLAFLLPIYHAIKPNWDLLYFS